METNKKGLTYHNIEKFEEIMEAIYKKLKENSCIIENIKTTDPEYLFNWKLTNQKNKLNKFVKDEIELISSYIEYVDFDSVYSLVLKSDEGREALKITLEKNYDVMYFVKLLESWGISNGYAVVEVILDDYILDELNQKKSPPLKILWRHYII